MNFSSRTLAVAVAALIVAALGYWGYGAIKQHVQRNDVAALVKDTGTRLRETLAIEAGPIAAINFETVRKLDEHVAAAERNRQALKRLDARGQQALVDAADDYLVTGQEILRRQATGHRNRLQLAASLQALREHFRADRGAGTWVREAVRLKEPVEKHFGDYRGAAEIFDKLLESFPASLARLASRSGAAPLIDDKLVAEARKRSNTALQQATDEVEKIRQYTVPR